MKEFVTKKSSFFSLLFPKVDLFCKKEQAHSVSDGSAQAWTFTVSEKSPAIALKNATKQTRKGLFMGLESGMERKTIKGCVHSVVRLWGGGHGAESVMGEFLYENQNEKSPNVEADHCFIYRYFDRKFLQYEHLFLLFWPRFTIFQRNFYDLSYMCEKWRYSTLNRVFVSCG